jgi:hypothetical protein
MGEGVMVMQGRGCMPRGVIHGRGVMQGRGVMSLISFSKDDINVLAFKKLFIQKKTLLAITLTKTALFHVVRLVYQVHFF